jgi:hypothetical protein
MSTIQKTTIISVSNNSNVSIPALTDIPFDFVNFENGFNFVAPGTTITIPATGNYKLYVNVIQTNGSSCPMALFNHTTNAFIPQTVSTCGGTTTASGQSVGGTQLVIPLIKNQVVSLRNNSVSFPCQLFSGNTEFATNNTVAVQMILELVNA